MTRSFGSFSLLLLLLCFSLASLSFFGSSLSLPSFDDGLVRDKFYALAAAAFPPKPTACLQKRFPGAQVLKVVNVVCDSLNSTCAAFLAVSYEEKALLLSFRGSSGETQLMDEILTSAVKKTPFPEVGGAAHSYFLHAFRALWSAGLEETVRAAAKAHPGYELWVTGHSLGAALASLAASSVSAAGLVAPSAIRLVSFGQPRSGNAAYADAHDRLVPLAFRVTHFRDLVVRLPPQHVLGFRHHATEVFYPNDMTTANFTVCVGQEDSNCSIGQIRFSWALHEVYFGLPASAWGFDGCP